MSTAVECKPEILKSGSYRVIGVSYVAGNGNSDFPGVWHKQLMPRIGEIARPANARCVGICRCIPGVSNGTWEYIAAVEASADAAVPEGMVAVEIPACEYATFVVNSLAEIGAAWAAAPKAAGELKGFEPYCGPKGCECATHPAFESYPADFEKTGRCYIYIPLKRA